MNMLELKNVRKHFGGIKADRELQPGCARRGRSSG